MRYGLLALGLTLLAVSGAARLDGARIENSGSTNAQGWTIAVHSDGTAWVAVGDGPARAFRVTPALAQRFLADLSRGRAAGLTGGGCMKSVSFGSRTAATWHGWTSPDLSCPARGALATALSGDVQAIQAAAGPLDLLRLKRIPG